MDVKKVVMIAATVIVTALIWMFVRVEPIFFYVESPVSESNVVEEINAEIRKRIEATARDISTVQTELHNMTECAYITTPKVSLFFAVDDVDDVSERVTPEVLAGHTVNMSHFTRKYSYNYRLLDKESGDEINNVREIEFEDDGKSYPLNIPGVDLGVSFRSSRSLYIEHPGSYIVHILDANTQCDTPLSQIKG